MTLLLPVPLADPSPGVYNEVVVPATYSGFLYCGPVTNKAGPSPPRRGRDGEGEPRDGRIQGQKVDGCECTAEGQRGEGWDGKVGPCLGIGWGPGDERETMPGGSIE